MRFLLILLCALVLGNGSLAVSYYYDRIHAYTNTGTLIRTINTWQHDIYQTDAPTPLRRDNAPSHFYPLGIHASADGYLYRWAQESGSRYLYRTATDGTGLAQYDVTVSPLGTTCSLTNVFTEPGGAVVLHKNIYGGDPSVKGAISVHTTTDYSVYRDRYITMDTGKLAAKSPIDGKVFFQRDNQPFLLYVYTAGLTPFRTSGYNTYIWPPRLFYFSDVSADGKFTLVAYNGATLYLQRATANYPAATVTVNTEAAITSTAAALGITWTGYAPSQITVTYGFGRAVTDASGNTYLVFRASVPGAWRYYVVKFNAALAPTAAWNLPVATHPNTTSGGWYYSLCLGPDGTIYVTDVIITTEVLPETDTDPEDDGGDEEPETGRNRESLAAPVDDIFGWQHLIYENEQVVYYCQRHLEGSTWTSPVQVSTVGVNAIKPDIAVNADRSLTALYETAETGTITEKTSRDHGITWS